MNKQVGVQHSHCRRAVFVSTASSQPRHQRRARMLLEAGMEVRVYAFGRGLYVGNTYADGIEVVPLGSIESGQYIKRLPTLFKAGSMIRTMEKRGGVPASFVYAFGLDALLISMLAIQKPIPLLYEVGDIRNPNPKQSLVSRLLYSIERKALRRVAALIVSSPAFLADYYRNMWPGVKGLVVENKLPSQFRLQPRPTARALHQPIRIGFVGLLRYPDSVLPLVDAVSRRSERFELHIYGDGPLRDVLQTRAEIHENVFYHGPFKNPDDLPNIYRTIDLNYVVYDNTDANVRMALPNKLYESIFFGTPIIAAENTRFADRVKQFKIGFVIDPGRLGFAEKFLDELSSDDVHKCSVNALSLPESFAVQNDEEVVAQLFELIGMGGDHK